MVMHVSSFQVSIGMLENQYKLWTILHVLISFVNGFVFGLYFSSTFVNEFNHKLKFLIHKVMI
jgi:hypothetical protein